MGAPSREGAAREATQRVTAALQAALAPADASVTPAASSRAVATVLARALRLLLVQMQILKADTANGRLALLAATLTPAAAVRHATESFAQRVALDAANIEEAALHAALPITAEFAASSPSAEHVTSQLAALHASQEGLAAAAAIPANLRAGRDSGKAAAPPPPGSLLAEPLLPVSCVVDSWEARFRCAVAALLVQPVDFVDNPAVPEVLQAYCAQLDEAKVWHSAHSVCALIAFLATPVKQG